MGWCGVGWAHGRRSALKLVTTLCVELMLVKVWDAPLLWTLGGELTGELVSAAAPAPGHLADRLSREVGLCYDPRARVAGDGGLEHLGCCRMA